MEHNRQIHIIGNMYAFAQGDKANVVIRPTDLQACLEYSFTCTHTTSHAGC